MPSITDQLASGEGRYRSALVIAGWGTIFADSLDLEDASRPDGRARIGGLDPETVKISATSDLVRADIVQEGSTIQIFEDYLERVSASLAAVPTARAWITTNVAASDTSIFVTSTDGFPANGVIHIGSEAVKYASKSANAFAGCTRGWWDTTALAHYTGDGTDRVAALVTDLPESFIGRRASLYMWGSSDSLNGDGTERWRGVVRDAPEYRAGVWSFSVEPIAWTLDQPVGGDYIDGVPIRGVYLPYSSAWDAILTRSTGASVTDTYDGTDSGRATLSGFQSTQDDFCTALTAEIDTVITSWTWDADSEITALPLGDDGYRLIYRVGATTPYWVHVVPQDPTNTLLSPVDRLTAGFNSWYAPADPDTTVTTMVAGSTYYLDVTAPVPRGALGERSGRLGYWRDESNPENRANRVYLGGVVTPTTDMIITVREGSDEDAPSNFSTVSVADTTDRYVEVSAVAIAVGDGLDQGLELGPTTRVRILKELAQGHVGDLIDALIADSPDSATLGNLPLVAATDWNTDWADLEDAISATSWGSRRWLAGGQPLTLRDLIVPDVQAVGCYLAVDSTGALAIKRLRPPLRTDPSVATVDSSVTVGTLPAISLSPQGHLREVVYRQGWNQVVGEHQGTSIRVRSLAVPTNTGGVLEIAPKSLPPVGASQEFSIEEAYLLASGALGLFGRPYRTLTMELSIAVMDALQLGSLASISTDFVPALDGTMGLSAIGLVIDYSWEIHEGKGRVTFLLQQLETGGYSPGFYVKSQSGSGTAWTVDVYLDSVLFTYPAVTGESTVGTWLAAGDEIRVVEYDTTTPTIVTGTIDSIDDSDTVSITFDSTWTPGASTWILSYDTTANVDETTNANGYKQTDFAMIAGTDRRTALASGDVDATEWGP